MQLNIFNNPKKHYSNGFGWKMVDLMFEQVLNLFFNVVTKTSFVSLSANEIIIIDNQSWISIHVYVM
jgi:hypothetical protein